MLDKKIHFREIEKRDNPAIAEVIRSSLEEFGENKPGTVYTDPTTDQLFELFQTKGATYFVALDGEKIIGGCGIFPTKGLPKGYAELVKLYLARDYRKTGIGKALMQKSIDHAKKLNYSHLYLESIPSLNNAVHLYRKLGFEEIDRRMGDSGHFRCNLWMVRKVLDGASLIK